MVQYFIIFIFMIFLLQSNCHDLCSPASGEDALRPTVPEELGSDVHEHVRQNHLDGMPRENGCSLGLITQGQPCPDGANGSISLGKTPARCKTGIWWTMVNSGELNLTALLYLVAYLMGSVHWWALCQVTFIFLCIWICSCKIFRKPCHGYCHNRVPRSKTWQVGSNKTSSNGNPLPVSQHTLFAHRSPTSSRQNKRRTGWHTKTGTQQPPKSQSFYFQLKLSLNLSP